MPETHIPPIPNVLIGAHFTYKVPGYHRSTSCAALNSGVYAFVVVFKEALKQSFKVTCNHEACLRCFLHNYYVSKIA